MSNGGLGFAPAELAPSLSFGGAVLVVWALHGFPWLSGCAGGAVAVLAWVFPTALAIVRSCRCAPLQRGPPAVRVDACARLTPASLLPPLPSSRLGVLRVLRLGLWHTAPLALLTPCASLFHGARLPSQALMFAALGFKAVAGAFAGREGQGGVGTVGLPGDSAATPRQAARGCAAVACGGGMRCG